ncbi:hypothetical protein [Phenylobacterium kunshanense]|uniref:hypothetical protein n=1 Tax=Phenylobacterium TaxID=20 RepID=UPI001057AB3F|nr:hypothetical protein [Phenylobacterium kunshanense]
MANSPTQDPPEAAGFLPDPDEVGPAVRDVAHNLTHDLSDTPDDLRDAAAAAPLIAVKLAQRFAAAVAHRPERAVAILAGVVALIWIGRRERRRRNR